MTTSDIDVAETLRDFLQNCPIDYKDVRSPEPYLPTPPYWESDDFVLDTSPQAYSQQSSQTVSPSHMVDPSEKPSTWPAPPPLAGSAGQGSSHSSEASAPGLSQELLQTMPREQPLTPFVSIDVQPKKTSRFRYQSELDKDHRITGVIPGWDSTPELPTYPTISLHDYSRDESRRPLVVVQCVTDKQPYIAHPNQLFGGNDTTMVVAGIAIAEINNDKAKFQLSKVGILRVLDKADAIEKSLEARARAMLKPLLPPLQTIFPLQYGVNPAAKFNMKSLRLAFQVFMPVDAHAWEGLEPVVTDVIHLVNKPTSADAANLPLEIDDFFPKKGSIDGGTTTVIYFQKEKVPKDLKVVFYEEGEQRWTAEAHIVKQKWGAITLLTPKYEGRSITSKERVQVNIQVSNLTGEIVSDSVPFQYQQVRLPVTKQDARAKRVCTVCAGCADSSNEEGHSTDDQSEYESDENEHELMKHFDLMNI